MAIIPDGKDWTWVLTRPCPECGFDAQGVTPATVASTVPTLVPRWQSVLRRPDAEERPDESTWSPLEYAAHVRDVFSLFDHRLHLMLEQEDPGFADWDQDATALAEDYAHQQPEKVSAELAAAGAEIAASFAAVRPAQWQRRGTRSNGSVFTVETFSQYFLHDVVHHLHDVDG
ncbi:DinB family protein [Paenarthrobacter sp. DKR-5]|uniref:DinB family protein n=1 Tax=Paenarthrobacter sp. DKR-5 TaxID=2835535 RepID=UPI001BDD78E5|nr:DinB family protein [Paenarthrobacter sp. DKR-5]MBT1002099.1 DinB family protein [Paenarthrobacter sp. DKR-5]